MSIRQIDPTFWVMRGVGYPSVDMTLVPNKKRMTITGIDYAEMESDKVDALITMLLLAREQMVEAPTPQEVAVEPQEDFLVDDEQEDVE